MLTLKVITTDPVGQKETHLFSGASIKHKEYSSTDHNILAKVRQNSPTAWILGDLPGSRTGQEFTVSDVYIYDEDRNLSQLLFIAPNADCYIMENGRTIDSLSCEIEESPITGGEKQ